MNTVFPKIGMVSCLFDLDDSQSLLYAKTIAAWGFDLVTICPGNIPSGLAQYSIEHHQVPSPSHHFDISSSFLNLLGGIFQRIRNSMIVLFFLLKTKPDICICIQPDSWLISIICKFFLHNRVVVDLREIYEDRAPAFPERIQPFIRRSFRMAFKILSRYTDEIIHVSGARQAHYSYLSKSGVVISPFPIMENYPDYKTDYESHEVIAVHAGSLRWGYASDQFLAAIPIILRQASNIKIIVIGGITSELKNKEILDEQVKQGNLAIISRIPHEEVIKILLRSDIGINLVLPLDQTHILAMPRKLFEYMAAGIPVVAADVPTLRNIVESSECGLLVDPTSPQSIAEGIIKLASEQELRKKMGYNGRKKCENLYNWEIESQKLRNLLISVCSF
jgi:glycosyltransferase involved in cell wall biosynthesis